MYLVSVIVLFIVTCVNSNGLPRTFHGCKGNTEVYIQWKQPLSGWYNVNLSSTARRQYKRVPPAVEDETFNTTLSKYVFTLEYDEIWNLSQWTKRTSKSILKTIMNEAIPDKFPDLTNVVPEVSASTSAKFRGRRSSHDKYQHQGDKKVNSKNKRGLTWTPTKKKETTPEIPERSIVDKKEPKEREFNVYCPHRCRCLKAVSMNKEFTRLDALSNETSEACFKRFTELSDLSDEIRNAFLELKNETEKLNETKNNSSKNNSYVVNEGVIKNNSYVVNEGVKNISFVANEVDIKNNSHKVDEVVPHYQQPWKPEYYVSDDCNALLYFDKTYDLWITDFEFLSKPCPEFEKDGLQTYYSTDSAPCLEFLPNHWSQKWENLQLQESLNDFQNNSDSIEHCDRNFTMRPSIKHFNVTCTKLGQ